MKKISCTFAADYYPSLKVYASQLEGKKGGTGLPDGDVMPLQTVL